MQRFEKSNCRDETRRNPREDPWRRKKGRMQLAAFAVMSVKNNPEIVGSFTRYSSKFVSNPSLDLNSLSFYGALQSLSP
jgi:hypothetical protein